VAGGSGSVSGFHGWSSGASGDGVAMGSFESWRGSPVTMAGTWNDSDAASQTDLPTLASEFKNWNGDLDVAVGGTVLGSGESYAEAAKGAYLDRWTAMAKNLQSLRGDKAGTTFARPFHEFNGDWYANWRVTPGNVADYQKAFRLMAQTIRANCPRCKVVWSPNNGTSSGSASPLDAYPGDAYVDVIGVDSYNANGATVVTSPQTWQEYADATNGPNPVGPEAWRKFAESRGKPISFPEWGLNSGGGGGDDPAYIQGMHDWMAEHAAKPGETNLGGKVVYDVYFNIAMGGNDGFLIKDGPNPQAARAYTTLAWGNTTTEDAGKAPSAPLPMEAGQPQAPAAQQQPQPVENVRIGPVGLTAGAQTFKNDRYATTSKAEVLDLFLPQRSGTAVGLVIDIHGGAFSGGDKSDSDVTANIQPLLAQGYAVASVNYRLSGETPFPAAIQDVKAAVRWLRAHAAGYGLDPNRFAVWGTSAGGYLATMAGVTGGQANAVLDDASLGNPGVSSAVAAVVSLYGPSDFSMMDRQAAQVTACTGKADVHDDVRSPESQWLGAPVQQSPAANASNPMAWITSAPAASLPAFLLGHGDADCTVRVVMAVEVAPARPGAAARVQLQVVPGAGHGDQALTGALAQPAITFVTQQLTAVSPGPAGPQPGPAPASAVPALNAAPAAGAAPAPAAGAGAGAGAGAAGPAPAVTSAGS
jgi:acetyl esterase/lipase